MWRGLVVAHDGMGAWSVTVLMWFEFGVVWFKFGLARFGGMMLWFETLAW